MLAVSFDLKFRCSMCMCARFLLLSQRWQTQRRISTAAFVYLVLLLRVTLFVRCRRERVRNSHHSSTAIRTAIGCGQVVGHASQRSFVT